jgi:hypothetical protein
MLVHMVKLAQIIGNHQVIYLMGVIFKYRAMEIWFCKYLNIKLTIKTGHQATSCRSPKKTNLDTVARFWCGTKFCNN